MNPDAVILDTSVFFSLLLRAESAARKRLLTGSGPVFYCPRFLFVELFKHKERIALASALDEADLLECLSELLARVRFIEEGTLLTGTWMEASRLCRDVDAKDTPFIALTLHLEGRLWTLDAELKTGLRAKGFDFFYEP